jgi:serine/threonine-protein kinase
VATQFREVAPALSPRGRFLAYASDESGEYEVYVRPFPNVDDWMMPISVDGGTEPIWSNDGQELFYRKTSTGNLMAVELETSDSLRIGNENALFPAAEYVSDSRRLHAQYDVSPDGTRFVMIRTHAGTEPEAELHVILVQNLFTELQQLLEARR